MSDITNAFRQSLTEFQATLLNRYEFENVKGLDDKTKVRSPFLALVNKERWAPKGSTISFQKTFGDATGLGPSMEIAALMARPMQYQKRTVDRDTLLKPMYDVYRFNRKELEVQSGDGADVYKDQLFSRMRHFEDGIASAIWQTGSGKLAAAGTFTSPANDKTVGFLMPLAGAYDVLQFRIGQLVELWDSTGAQRRGTAAGSIVAATEVYQVTKLHIKANSIYLVKVTADRSLTPAVDSPAGDRRPASGDIVYRAGMKGVMPLGIPSYVLESDPSSGDSFQGLNRSVQPERLAGWRHEWLGSFTQSVTAAATVQTWSMDRSARGSDSRICWMNSDDYMRYFHKEAVSLYGGIKVNDELTATLGLDVAEIMTPAGVVYVTHDPFKPSGKAHLMDMSQVRIVYGEESLIVNPNDMHGGQRFVANQDYFEVSLTTSFALDVLDPGSCGVITLG